MSIEGIEKEVLEKIKPKPDEYNHVFKIFNYIKNIVEKILSRHRVEAEVTLQGSIAHDTWLSGDRDLDIFVLYPLDWSVEELKTRGFEILLEAAKEIGKYEIRYAEHPYVRVFVEDVEADLVPAFNVKDASDIRTAVDRTPLHTRYVMKHLTPELKDHVRLLKKFMKSIGVYGAEIRNRGFSGYLVELLVITYKGFREVLREASNWRHPVYINTLMNKEYFREIIRKLRRRYPDSVIYAPDPVDPLRNTAAAVSLRSLVLFSTASKCYLRKPSIGYFFPEPPKLEVEALNMANRCIVFLEVKFDEKLPPETIWGEIQRVMDRVVKVLWNNDFKPVDWSYWSDEEYLGVIGIELEECIRPYYRVYEGPEYYYASRVTSFIEKHIARQSIGPWIRLDGKLLALSKRRFIHVEDVLSERYWEYMVAPHLRGRKPVIYTLNEYLSRVEDRELKRWIIEFITKRPYWMNYCIQ